MCATENKGCASESVALHLFNGCFKLRKPDMVELFREALFEDFLREEILLDLCS